MHHVVNEKLKVEGVGEKTVQYFRKNDINTSLGIFGCFHIVTRRALETEFSHQKHV